VFSAHSNIYRVRFPDNNAASVILLNPATSAAAADGCSVRSASEGRDRRLRLDELGFHQRDDVEFLFLDHFRQQGAFVFPRVVAVAVPEKDLELLVATFERPVDVGPRLLGLKKKDSDRFPDVFEKCI
jgi:hypothetical protein